MFLREVPIKNGDQDILPDMRDMKKILIFILLWVAFVPLCSAQEISISSSVDRAQVPLDQQAILRITVSGNVPNLSQPQIPQIQGFNIYSSGQSQNVSIVNGQMSSSITFNFVLTPQKVGKFVIPAMSLQYAGRIYSTEPINMEVVAGQAVPSPSQSQPSSQAPAPSQAGGQVFVAGSVDKKTVYVNEQITYSFRFYRAVQLLSNPQYKPPDFTGFWMEDLPPQTTYYQDVNGQRYFVVELKTAFFPTAPGEYTIGSASLVCNIEDFSSNDFFRSFFSGGKTQTLATEPIRIKVLPLPQNGKPKDFTGMVGQYKISAQTDKTNVECNQPITLKITVSGKGNIKTVSQPKIEGLKSLRKYETISSLNISKENYTVQGSKTFTTMLLPQVPGALEIPRIQTNYFDPAEKTYKTISTPVINLKVTPSTKPAPQIPAAFAPKGIKFLNKDIRYIKTVSSFSRRSGFLYEQPWFLFLQFIPLFAILFLYIYSRHYNKLVNDKSYARLHTAYGLAAKILKKAEKDDPAATACAVSSALVNYIAGKLDLSAAGITSSLIRDELKKAGADEGTIKEILDIIERCDFARFAPAQMSQDEAARLYDNAGTMIEKLENIFKKRKK